MGLRTVIRPVHHTNGRPGDWIVFRPMPNVKIPHQNQMRRSAVLDEKPQVHLSFGRFWMTIRVRRFWAVRGVL